MNEDFLKIGSELNKIEKTGGIGNEQKLLDLVSGRF